MSPITTDLAEISNSEQKPVTVILFGTNRNLTRTELKKIFAVQKGKLYKTRNRHNFESDVFDMLFAVRASRPADGLFVNYKSKNFVSHIYVVAQGTCIKEFAILKYGTDLLGGFVVFKSEMEDLQKLLEAYRAVASFCVRANNILSGLQEQAETVADSHLITSSKFQELLSNSLQELNEMTNPAISLAKKNVDTWYDKHFWKDVHLSCEAVSDKPIQLSAMGEVC